MAENKTHIYLLFNEGLCVYIGRTTQGIKRLHRHRYEKKPFTGWYMFEVPADEAKGLERSMIEGVRPEYNKLYV